MTDSGDERRNSKSDAGDRRKEVKRMIEHGLLAILYGGLAVGYLVLAIRFK